MSYTADWSAESLSREQVDRLPGVTVLEFGTGWCPHCQAVQASLRQALEGRREIRHLKIEDGKGRPLGRAFGVKLWPNFVLLRDGEVLSQWARPETEELLRALEQLA
jgi:thioredoxin 1